jgi:hypothetical protein
VSLSNFNHPKNRGKMSVSSNEGEHPYPREMIAKELKFSGI